MSIEESLRNAMEEVRRELNNLQYQYGLGHPCFIRQSMVLDELINQYNRMFYGQTRECLPTVSNLQYGGY
ncbi:aspartyl-phosphate phosphatase Spo0E family protein [Paenibacillus sp. NFR01]|uniref:aspartyl-phosphate phosphatase Spo0E family protein n=1 Tax=Paenibacillus sp. NFR01 TaxID=1566279 RepID=UPI0008C30AF4|nr:aspartyl-phosphate phosphatase Spo0E family protein [Paenibacillus sp. NFR01]SEU27346.1 Spo0E like sporulation regulatory protein [Paenibacillus sp. NFR01]